MRLLLYNIRYATGIGPGFHFPLPMAGYLKRTSRNLRRIVEFVQHARPDVTGLIEVDMGSVRTASVSQPEAIADALGHQHSFQSKYAVQSLNKRLPIVSKQGNAFLSGEMIVAERYHYFDAGIKRLIMELELESVSIFLVHLSVKFRHRHYQLRHLHELVAASQKPVIVAGDFNTLWGDYELHLFMEAAGLHNANTGDLPTYPSWAPRRQLDFVLFSEGIHVNGFEIPQVQLSDHLPLICDFEVTGSGPGRAPPKSAA